MTPLTQSELDALQLEATKFGAITLFSAKAILSLLDHIAQLTAERDGVRKEVDRLKEQYEVAHDIAQKCFNQRETAQHELKEANARIAELEAQPSAQFVAGMRRAAEIADQVAHIVLQTASKEFEEGFCDGATRVLGIIQREVAAILAEAALKGEGK